MSADRLTEDLLDAWMRMSMGIKGNRILETMSFNEMVICRILYKAGQEGAEVTATDICRRSRLLKSQVNRLLNDMEKKQLIHRTRDRADKRRVLVSLREESTDVYLKEHTHVMEIVGKIRDQLGVEEAQLLTEKMDKVVRLMDENA